MQRSGQSARRCTGWVSSRPEEVLTEVLAFFSERGQYLRELSTAAVRSICANSTMMVLPQSHQTFITGLVLYEARPDKGYSLTDCISMEAMRREGITEILTHALSHRFYRRIFNLTNEL